MDLASSTTPSVRFRPPRARARLSYSGISAAACCRFSGSEAAGAVFIRAFQALPVVLVMSVLTTLLFYWRILPPVVRGMAWLLERTLRGGGPVSRRTGAPI